MPLRAICDNQIFFQLLMHKALFKKTQKKRYSEEYGYRLFARSATYLAASGAADVFSALSDLCDLCACLCFIGAALAVGALAESFAEAGSAANALAPKVAAKIPASNADNNLFMINFLYKIKCDV